MKVFETLREKYEKSTEERLEKVVAGDEVLYQMCKQYSNHTKYDLVNAKVGIISRAYQTFIERQIRTINLKWKKRNSMDQLVSFVLKNGKKIDREITKIRNLENQKDTLKVMNEIVKSHFLLVKLFKKLLRENRSARSFLSKYLHFHSQIVPVFDRQVSTNIKKFIKESDVRKLDRNFKDKEGDCDYSNYVKRLIVFSENLEIDLLTNVKNLDYFIFSLKK